MERARRHSRLLSRLALGLLALVVELAGRSLTHRIDLGRHVGPVSYAHEDYYPVLLVGVKVGVALMLARLAWRFAKATGALREARRLGGRPQRAARVPIELSGRLWLAAFLVTSTIYLVQEDAEGFASGRWPLLSPWLHSSALPVFAVLAVVVAVVYRAVEGWLGDVERLAADALLLARRRLAAAAAARPPHPRDDGDDLGPRSRFGLAFESRPPPAPA